MASLYLDSIDNIFKNEVYDSYGTLFQFAKTNGWNEISKNEYISLEKGLKGKTDEFSSISIYQHNSSPKFINQNGFFLYYTKSSGEHPNLFLKIQYHGDDWLFINSAKVNIDGGTYSFNITNWDRDHSSGKVYEWGNERIEYFNLMTHILNGKSIKVRLTGDKYYRDVIITKAQKNAIEEVLKVYYGLYLKDKFKIES